MPEISRLLAKCPGPTAGEVEDNPERYPEEGAMLRNAAQSLVDAASSRFLAEWRPISERILDNWRPMSDVAAVISLGRWEPPNFHDLVRPALENMQTAVAAMFAELTAPIRRLWEPGTLQGDLMLVRRDKDPAALERLARRFKWAPRDPAARVALDLRAQEVGFEQARVEAMMVGIFMALQRMDDLQRIRFGRTEYIVGDDGRPVCLRPKSLPLLKDINEPGFWYWLRKESVNAAESYLLAREYPEASQSASVIVVPHDEAPLLVDEQQAADPLEVMLQAEDQHEINRLLAEVQAVVSPRQRQLLAAMLDAPTLAKAAATVGMGPATARVQIFRLRQKLLAKM